ncbi:MAG: DUF3791 domain-containing protein [Sarcina sp.]
MNEKNLEFVIFCVESVAEKLNLDAKEVYNLLEEKNIINEYIIPCYEPLHTQGKQYIVTDLVEVMKIKGVL